MLHRYDYIVFDLCCRRNNSLDSAVESIIWVDIKLDSFK